MNVTSKSVQLWLGLRLLSTLNQAPSLIALALKTAIVVTPTAVWNVLVVSTLKRAGSVPCAKMRYLTALSAPQPHSAPAVIVTGSQSVTQVGAFATLVTSLTLYWTL